MDSRRKLRRLFHDYSARHQCRLIKQHVDIEFSQIMANITAANNVKAERERNNSEIREPLRSTHLAQAAIPRILTTTTNENKSKNGHLPTGNYTRANEKLKVALVDSDVEAAKRKLDDKSWCHERNTKEPYSHFIVYVPTPPEDYTYEDIEISTPEIVKQEEINETHEHLEQDEEETRVDKTMAIDSIQQQAAVAENESYLPSPPQFEDNQITKTELARMSSVDREIFSIMNMQRAIKQAESLEKRLNFIIQRKEETPLHQINGVVGINRNRRKFSDLLPLKTMASLVQYSKELEVDVVQQEAFKQYISLIKIHGDAGPIIRAVLKRILTYECAMNYNMDGINRKTINGIPTGYNKSSFKKLHIYRVLIDVMCDKFSIPEDETQLITANWLKSAKTNYESAIARANEGT